MMDRDTTGIQLKGTFVDAKFKEKYQRNNKRGGLKNLRCFPTCGKVHKARGFCGKPIEVKIEAEGLEDGALAAFEVCVFAEFVPYLGEQRYKLGEVVKKEDILAICRHTGGPREPLIIGEASEPAQAIGSRKMAWRFELNRGKKGWHYGWAANKHSCNTEHVLRVYVFLRPKKMTTSELVFGLSFVSPSFVLYCRRRRRFINENETNEESIEESARLKRSLESEESEEETTSPKRRFLSSTNLSKINTSGVSDSESVASTVVLEHGVLSNNERVSPCKSFTGMAEEDVNMANFLVDFANVAAGLSPGR